MLAAGISDRTKLSFGEISRFLGLCVHPFRTCTTDDEEEIVIEVLCTHNEDMCTLNLHISVKLPHN